AYELTNNIAYKAAAEKAGAYSLSVAGYNSSGGTWTGSLTGAEVYSMARLSAIQATPASNSWRTALVDYLDAADAGYLVGWYGINADDSSAVYDVARRAVAAEYVNHADKAIWRDGVITLLGDVDDADASPVMALGAAVWALTATGDISTDTDVVSVLGGVQIKDLPDELAALQDVADGSFYTKFDTAAGSGYTETTVMGTLGLQAADASSLAYSYSSEIASAVGVLKGGVGAGGEVYWKISDSLSGGYAFAAGETLEAIPEPATMTVLLIGAVGVIRRRRNKV
ncbi:MAG: PEP-CTERM sorting domain-containing protein, partial [Phycisphaerales bacterium]|nr:PEP-CTERM sorting domain-containing protein [Phycisphaerales bacterium]